MQVGRAALDGIDQYFVDEAHHRRIVDFGGGFGGRFLLRADFEIIEVLEIRFLHVAETGVGGFERFLNRLGELALLDQDGVGVRADMKFDLVQGLQVGGIGDRDIDPVAALKNGQRMVALDQLHADELDDFRIDFERFDVEQRHAELMRCGVRDDLALGKFVVDQVFNERDAGAERVLERANDGLLVEQAVRNKFSCEPAQRHSIAGYCHRFGLGFCVGLFDKMVDESRVNSHRHSLFWRRAPLPCASVRGYLGFELEPTRTAAHMHRVAFSEAAFEQGLRQRGLQ